MKKVLIILVFLLLFSGKVAHAQGSPLFQESIVWQSHETNLWPHFVYGLVVSNKNTILTFCEGRIQPWDDQAHHVLLKRSTDYGRTWGPNQYIVTSSNNESFGNPTPVVDRNSGKIYLFYGENFSNNSTKLLYKVSSDDGVTWSTSTDITSLFKDNQYGWTFHLPGPGHGIQLNSGRLILPVWHRKAITYSIEGRNYGVSVIYSDDGGLSWQKGGTINTGYKMSESRLVQLKDGSLLLSARTFDNVRAVSRSIDEGITWSQPVYSSAIKNINNIDSGLIVVNQIPGETEERMLFSYPNSLEREKMTVSLSYDQGNTWKYSKLITSDRAYYSDLVLLPDRSIGLLYGKGGSDQSLPGYVAFARFNLQWLTDGKDYINNNTDVNGDGKVDLIDFSLWKQEYLKKVTTLKADFNKDGTVNLIDFSIWKREYSRK